MDRPFPRFPAHCQSDCVTDIDKSEPDSLSIFYLWIYRKDFEPILDSRDLKFGGRSQSSPHYPWINRIFWRCSNRDTASFRIGYGVVSYGCSTVQDTIIYYLPGVWCPWILLFSKESESFKQLARVWEVLWRSFPLATPRNARIDTHICHLLEALAKAFPLPAWKSCSSGSTIL